MFQEGLDLCRQIGSQPGIASALQHLADIALDAGDADRAEELYREALEIDRRLNNKRGIAFSLAGLGAVALERRDVNRGAQILGAAERLGGAKGAEASPDEQLWWRTHLAPAVEAMGSAACDELLEKGRALPLETAINLALSPERAASPAGSPST